MDRGSRGRGREGSWDQSFLSFRGPPRPECAQPGQIQAKPGQAEMGRSHASNKSHTDMETLREVLFKQALFHTVSYLPIHGLCHREMMSQQPIMHLSVLISTQSFCLRQPVDIWLCKTNKAFKTLTLSLRDNSAPLTAYTGFRTIIRCLFIPIFLCWSLILLVFMTKNINSQV